MLLLLLVIAAVRPDVQSHLKSGQVPRDNMDNSKITIKLLKD